MKCAVVFSRSSQKELAALQGKMRLRVAKAIRALETEPFPRSVKKLQNRDGYRLRVGDYRVLYTFDAEKKIIFISAIGHRREVYR